MAKIQDIDIPYLEFAEAAAPGTPASGIVRIYAKSDGSLYQKDDAGTETGLAGGGGGSSVATDTIWDAAGDLAVGSGANTAAKLTKGSAGGVLAMSNGAVTWNAGTSFPGSPATNDRYYRTDRGIEYFYDGTRWLSVTLYRDTFTQGDTLQNSATSPIVFNRTTVWNGDYDLWLVDFYASTFPGSTNNGSNYWTVKIRKFDVDNANSDIDSFTTAADTASKWTRHKETLGVALGTSFYGLDVQATKTGGPTNLYVHAALTYRLIG